jgi:selenocysteine lyase/cysteine desulfurase
MKTNLTIEPNTSELIIETKEENIKQAEILSSMWPFSELEKGIFAALETYSNVHRGSGFNSSVTTKLFDKAREIFLDTLKLDRNSYTVIFCTSRRAGILKLQVGQENYKVLSSQDLGLSIGIKAFAVKKKSLPKGVPFQSGGGTARLISKDWVVWDKAPGRFEAGTPAIINIIAFARALGMIKKYGPDIFKDPALESKSVKELLYHDEMVNCSGKELLDQLHQTLIGKEMIIPTQEGEKPFINLDNSASTPTFIPIWNTYRQSLAQSIPVQKELVNEVKSICCDFLSASKNDYEVIFTSNATEALNLVAENMSYEYDEKIEPVIVNTILEHSSNELPWRTIPGCSLIRLSVNDEGFIDLHELDTLLNSYNKNKLFGNKRIRLVAISGASNVLGVCNKIGEISRIVHQYDAKLLVDGAQLVAHQKVDMTADNIDYLTFSAHKIYTPFGCGVLAVRKGLLNFNTEEIMSIRSSGEENVAGIAALGKALNLLKKIGMELIHHEEQLLTARLLQGILKVKGVKVYGIMDPQSSSFENKVGVIAFTVGSRISSGIAKELAVRGGIGSRFGCHCSHIIVKHILHVPPALERFQWVIVKLFSGIQLPGVARISLGIENTKEEVDTFLQVLENISLNSDKTTIGTPLLTKAYVESQIKTFADKRIQLVYGF